ncbi:hypothetical protein MBLNU459_g7514t1 [Dothideomycetes sp. NU459]
MQHSLAILDDYPGVAPQFFKSIPNLVKIDSFPDTILPKDEKSIASLAARLQPYTIISSMRERTPFPRELISKLPNLKLLVTTGTRNLALDLDAARDHGVIVAGTTGKRANLPGMIMPAPTFDFTTQHCFSLLLALTSRIPVDNAAIRAGGWQTGLGTTLSGKTFGCVGLGRLGGHAAKTAILGFGMRVVAWSANLSQEKCDAAAERLGLPAGAIAAVSQAELLAGADVVSLHYLLSERSRGLLGARELAQMKPSAVLLNTSRGPLIDEQALLDVLRRGAIAGAGLDVFWEEPLPADSPWRTSEWKSEVVLSPHMGYGNPEVIHTWYAEQAETVEKFLKGEELPDVMT